MSRRTIGRQSSEAKKEERGRWGELDGALRERASVGGGTVQCKQRGSLNGRINRGQNNNRTEGYLLDNIVPIVFAPSIGMTSTRQTMLTTTTATTTAAMTTTTMIMTIATATTAMMSMMTTITFILPSMTIVVAAVVAAVVVVV